MINRIKSLLDYSKINESAFSNIIGIPQRTLNYYINEKRKPSFELVEKILNAYPDVSAEWLLRGEGPMLKSDTPNKEETETLKKFLKQTDALLAIRDERIRKLELENAALISGSDIKEVG